LKNENALLKQSVEILKKQNNKDDDVLNFFYGDIEVDEDAETVVPEDDDIYDAETVIPEEPEEDSDYYDGETVRN
jgi:hypothetical protein